MLVLLVPLIFAQAALPVTVAACGSGSSSQAVVLSGVGETGAPCNDSGVTNTIKIAVQILSYFVGAAAIIMVIAAGFRYTTSGGDSNRVSSAKTTLIYALVGMAIAALAQLLVHYVLSNATTSTTPCPYTIAGHPDLAVNDNLCVKPN